MIGVVNAQCSSVGYGSYTSKVGDGASTPTGGQYLMTQGRFEIDCCGLVSSWSISAHNTGELALQIWRLDGGSTYRLIGENVVNVSSTGDNTFAVSSSDYISVESGDFVGWYTAGVPIVDWENQGGVGTTFNYLTSGASATAVGATAIFSATNNEEYAVYATVSALAGPTFSNLPGSVVSSRSALSAGTTIFTAVATISGNSSITYSLQSESPAGAFLLDSTTGAVSPTSSNTAPNTYTLTIRATDTCGSNDEQDLTITVTNAVPELHGLPLVVDISESAVDETLLHLINVTDADGDTVTCTVTSAPSGPFTEKFNNGAVAGEILTGIYLQANPNLDYDVASSYVITVSCTDTVDTTVGTVYVYVVKNNVPVINNLQNATSITSVTPSNTAIFEVLYSDVEGDEVTFSLACSPVSPCPFAIYSTGQIFLSQSILETSTSAYEMDITISDAYTSSGTHRLTVYVTDLNTVPELANLPATIQVTEDTAVGTTVYTLSVYDEDGGTGHTLTTSFSPSAGAGIFSLQNNYVTLAAQLDYFTQATSYNMSVEASDGQAISATSWLVLEIVNVNEAPVLYQANYQVQSEEAAAGSSFPNIQFNVFDPDGDNLTYAFEPASDTYGFSIASTTGAISLTLDYDRENTGLGSSSRVWLVRISDPLGLSVTATLTVSILDKEDNVPQLSSTSYTGSVSSDATVGQVVTTASATDADATAVNGVLEYSVSGTSVFNVDGSGNIVVFTGLTGLQNTQYTFTLMVKNPGSTLNDTATVSIYVTEPSSDSFFDKAENIALVTIVSIIGLALLSGLAYLAINAYYKTANIPAPPPYKATQVAPTDTKFPDSTKSWRSLKSPEVNRPEWSAWDNQWY